MDVQLKRNVILAGHAHSGKTSMVESMLFLSGATSRKGDVMQGTTVSDFNEDERDRKISINASFLKTTFNKHQIQIIDTPGYMDFVGETVAALSVADAAIVVVDAVNGVEVGTEDIWQRLDVLNLPRIVFINKTDKEEAKLEATIASIREELSNKAAVIDLNSSELMEAVAESDDQLLEKYLEAGSLTPDEVKGALRKSVLDGKLFPILSGSATSDKGIKELLEAIIEYLPNCLERVPFQGKDPSSKEDKTIAMSVDDPFVGFVFKSMFDPHLGNVSIMRILRGRISPNMDCLNVTNGGKEKIGMINILQGKEQSTLPQADCGDIVAIPKLKNTHTSHTLTDPKNTVLINPIEFPEPSISASIKPKTRSDEEKISASLHRLCEEDLTFKVNRNAETKELIVSGIGDLHLKILLERMKDRYRVDVEMGTPKVTYRETITKAARHRYKYKKQSGGRGQYGDVDLEVAPLPLNETEYEFVNKIFGGAIPRNYIPSVEKGVKHTIADGVLANYPIHHIRVTVVDGSYHDVDSSDMAFQIAGSMALKEAIKQARPVLLEPIMEVSVVVPDDFIGPISGDISSRRGRIMGSEAKGKKQVIKAHVPLSEMFSYATDLRSMTQGRGSYTMKLSHYEQAPEKITQQVIAQQQKKD